MVSNRFIWATDGTPKGADTQGQIRPREKWSCRGTPHFSKLQDWSLAIRWFCVIPRTLVEKGSYPSTELQSVYSTAPANRAAWQWGWINNNDNNNSVTEGEVLLVRGQPLIKLSSIIRLEILQVSSRTRLNLDFIIPRSLVWVI